MPANEFLKIINNLGKCALQMNKTESISMYVPSFNFQKLANRINEEIFDEKLQIIYDKVIVI